MIVSSSNRHKQKDNPKSRIKWHCWRREVEDGIVRSWLIHAISEEKRRDRNMTEK